MIPRIREIAHRAKASLIFWRIDWGHVTADAKGTLETNLHIHFAISCDDDHSFSKGWSLWREFAAGIPDLGFFLSVWRSTDARRLPGYLYLPGYARRYRLITDQQLVTFFRMVSDERKLSACGPFYDFKAEKKKTIRCIRRIPRGKDGWNITVEPKDPPPPEPDNAPEEDKKDDFPYHIRPLVAAMKTPKYGLILEIRRRSGCPWGDIPFAEIKEHPWVKSLIKLAEEAAKRNTSP